MPSDELQVMTTGAEQQVISSMMRWRHAEREEKEAEQRAAEAEYRAAQKEAVLRRMQREGLQPVAGSCEVQLSPEDLEELSVLI